MTKVCVNVEFDTPPRELWKVIGGFNALPDWHPGVAASTIDYVGVPMSGSTRTSFHTERTGVESSSMSCDLRSISACAALISVRSRTMPEKIRWRPALPNCMTSCTLSSMGKTVPSFRCPCASRRSDRTTDIADRHAGRRLGEGDLLQAVLHRPKGAGRFVAQVTVIDERDKVVQKVAGLLAVALDRYLGAREIARDALGGHPIVEDLGAVLFELARERLGPGRSRRVQHPGALPC